MKDVIIFSNNYLFIRQNDTNIPLKAIEIKAYNKNFKTVNWYSNKYLQDVEINYNKIITGGKLINYNDKTITYLYNNKKVVSKYDYFTTNDKQNQKIINDKDNIEFLTYIYKINVNFTLDIILTSNSANYTAKLSVNLAELLSNNKIFDVYVNPLAQQNYNTVLSSNLVASRTLTNTNNTSEDNYDQLNVQHINNTTLYAGEQEIILQSGKTEYSFYHLINTEDSIFLRLIDLPINYYNVNIYDENLNLLRNTNITRFNNVSYFKFNNTNNLVINNSTKTSERHKIVYHIDVKINIQDDYPAY